MLSEKSFVVVLLVTDDFIDDVDDASVTDDGFALCVLRYFRGTDSVDSSVASDLVTVNDSSDVVDSSASELVATSSTSATPSTTILYDESAINRKIMSVYIVRMLMTCRPR